MTDTLTLACAPARREVFVGESLAVSVVLTNAGAAACEVVAPGSPDPPPLSFELRAAASGAVVHQVSRQALEVELAGDEEWEPLDSELLSLASGAAVTYQADLSELTLSSFAPGDYQLVARYQGSTPVDSPPVALRVVVPQVHHLASLACPVRRLICTAYDHLGQGAVKLLSREPFAEDPDSGVFYRWLSFTGLDQLGGVSLAIHTAPRAEGRWLAWIQQRHLSAVRPWGDTLGLQVNPRRLALEASLLAEPGFQLADGSGLFVAAGEVSGEAYVTLVSLSGETAGPSTVVPLAPELPGRLLACLSEDCGRIHLVWSEGSGPVRILRRTYRVDGRPEDPAPALLLERDAPLLALELFPRDCEPSGGYAHALLGPPEPDAPLSYFRLPLGSAGWKLEEWQVPLPDDPVDDWAIAASPADGLPVAARCGDRLLLARARLASGWQQVSEGMMGLTHLHLLVTEGARLWAGWCEPGVGPVYLQVTAR